MGRMYVLTIAAAAKTVSEDYFEITPADDKPVRLHALYIAQYTDVGDAAEEILTVAIIRAYTTSGSGGSAFTPLPLDKNDAAAGFAAEISNTTLATTGTAEVLHSDAWNIRIPYVWLPTPEMRPRISQADTRVVVRVSAPADSITVNATLYVEEL